jgi:hypothetical protein
VIIPNLQILALINDLEDSASGYLPWHTGVVSQQLPSQILSTHWPHNTAAMTGVSATFFYLVLVRRIFKVAC